MALTRAVPTSIARCELTHLTREPIDFHRAVAEHDAYEAALEALGCRVERLPDAADLPDAVFVEDTAVVFDEIAVITWPGAASRRPEIGSVVSRLQGLRSLAFIQQPDTLDGGDVLVTPSRVFVGVSERTSEGGARQLASLLAPLEIKTSLIPIAECLHLKSAVTLVDDQTLLINPEWIAASHFPGFRLLQVDPSEPFAANVLRIGPHVLCASHHPRTRQRLEAERVATMAVDATELAKAEGGLTCCSLILRDGVLGC